MFLLFLRILILILCLKAGDNGESATNSIEAIIADCLKENGVTEADISLYERTGNVSSINSCYYGCYYKKNGIVSIYTAVFYKRIYFSCNMILLL